MPIFTVALLMPIVRMKSFILSSCRLPTHHPVPANHASWIESENSRNGEVFRGFKDTSPSFFRRAGDLS